MPNCERYGGIADDGQSPSCRSKGLRLYQWCGACHDALAKRNARTEHLDLPKQLELPEGRYDFLRCRLPTDRQLVVAVPVRLDKQELASAIKHLEGVVETMKTIEPAPDA